jgi:hypothetical protein
MPNPKPEHFAKQILWHVCGVEAQLVQLQNAILTDMAARGMDTNALTLKLKEERLRWQKELFSEAAQECGLIGEQDEDNPPDLPTSRMPTE